MCFKPLPRSLRKPQKNNFIFLVWLYTETTINKLCCRHYFSVDFTRFPIQEVQGAGAGEVNIDFVILSQSLLIKLIFDSFSYLTFLQLHEFYAYKRVCITLRHFFLPMYLVLFICFCFSPSVSWFLFLSVSSAVTLTKECVYVDVY